jgi:hypothetical protein
MTGVLTLRGERSRELVRLLARAGDGGVASDDLARRMGLPVRNVLGLVAKLRERHGAPIENIAGPTPGRSNHGRYRLAAPVSVRAPRRVPKSRPGHAPCRCQRMREGVRCPRCRMAEAYRSGRHRRSRPSIRPDVWEPSHDAFLATLVGRSESEMAAAFQARFRFRRTGQAIRKRMLDLGLDTRQDGWTIQALSRLFGTTADRVLRAWVRAGLLAGRKGEPSRQSKLDGTREQWWRISDAEVERFIRAYPWEYDWRTMQAGHRLATIAREVGRRDGYLSAKEAGRALGISAQEVARLVRRGELPAKRVTPTSGGAGRDLRIAAADVVAYGRLERAS